MVLADRGDPVLKSLPAFVDTIVKRFSPPDVLALLDDSLNFAGFVMAPSSVSKKKKRKKGNRHF